MNRKLYSIALFCYLNAGSLQAQTAGFHYRAKIDSIRESGLYNIELTAAINAHLKTDYSDLRIINQAGKWVPHLIRKPNGAAVVEETAINFPIVKKENSTTISKITVKNSAEKISNLVFGLKNTEAEKFGMLTGSDDGKNWFTIIDSIEIKPQKARGNNPATFTIDFPPVYYKYYQLAINNNGKAPFNIISACNLASTGANTRNSNLESIENPAATFVQKDSGNQSFIRVTQQAAYHFDKFSIKIDGLKYFYRQAALYFPQSATHSFSNPGQQIQSFTIDNNSELKFTVNTSNAVTFYILIQNEDNLPLKLSEVKTFNTHFVATAYLEQGNQYSVLLDNAAAITPNYDTKQLSFYNSN